ncbi:MAG: response regulator, partial [Verrucomicrobiota bacterium]|nr:response regulator [Verrucomicrobiota bacterium]
VRIDVEDEGVGIQLDSNGKVFEPFYTTKPVGKGTGLGLSLVYTYMREIGGAIRVESGAEVGTVFSLFVPVTTPDLVVTENKPRTSDVSPGQGRILLAEDDESVSRPMETVLRNAGYEVWSCENGLEAVDRYRSQGPEIDLVVLDLRMPLLNGAEAFLEMRRMDPSVRAVIISGNAQNEDLRELSQRGLVGSLRKPFVERELLEFISGAMHG